VRPFSGDLILRSERSSRLEGCGAGENLGVTP
jgi:hypothetical protein